MPNKKPKKQDKSQWVPQREKIQFDLNIREFPFTEKQQAFIELVNHKDTRVVFLDGPAGSSKTFLAVYAGLTMLQERKNGEIVYVRSLVESAEKGIGYLPGQAADKFSPFATPLMDKLEELLPKGEIQRLVAEERIRPIPVNFMRGLSLYATTCIVDECQNFSPKEIITVLTRIGKFSKFLFLGDHQQSDIKTKNGFSQILEIFNNQESMNEGIYSVKFDKTDIMRSDILKFIIGKLEEGGLA
jgi:phosphate starvation-inducible protein PhoH and related proteins